MQVILFNKNEKLQETTWLKHIGHSDYSEVQSNYFRISSPCSNQASFDQAVNLAAEYKAPILTTTEFDCFQDTISRHACSLNLNYLINYLIKWDALVNPGDQESLLSWLVIKWTLAKQQLNFSFYYILVYSSC